MRNEVVGDLTEAELIARIQRQLPPRPDWMLVGIGDDAAVVEPERNRVEVLTVDALVEGVHFDRAFVPPDAIGHRALAVNLSDLAAMGAAPRLGAAVDGVAGPAPRRRFRRSHLGIHGAGGAPSAPPRRRQPHAIPGSADARRHRARHGQAPAGAFCARRPDPRDARTSVARSARRSSLLMANQTLTAGRRTREGRDRRSTALNEII